MSGHYTVIYNGENLYEYQMTPKEKEITEAFRTELMDICERLAVPRANRRDGSLWMGRLLDDHDFALRYREDIGFFVLYGERGIFQMADGFPTVDREQAKFLMLKTEFQDGGFTYELNSRNVLKEAWKNRYAIEYDSRKAAFEFMIKLLATVFGDCPPEVIERYTDLMNKWFETKHWYWDSEKESFEELGNRWNVRDQCKEQPRDIYPMSFFMRIKKLFTK